MTQRNENQPAHIKAISAIAKLAGKDAKSTVIAILTVIVFWLMYENHKKDLRNNEIVDVYNVLIFGLVKDVNKNSNEIEKIATKQEIKDSLKIK